MKKILFMVAAVALAMVSCNKEEINTPVFPQEGEASDIVFVAEFDQEAQTKTALGEVVDGKRQATWAAGDAISINGTTFTAKADGATAEFTTTDEFTEAEVYRAVYPAGSYKSGAVMIPASQDGTFANASIAVAESNNQSLKFSNVSSILKFQVAAACETVTFESTNSIAGNVSVIYENGVMTPNYGSLQNFSKKITVKAEGGFVAGKDYYVAVKPGEQKFNVSIDGKLSKASTKTITVERSKIHNMGTLIYDPNYIDASAYGLVGSFQGWDVANPVAMEYVSDGWIVAKNVELYKNDEFKFAKDKKWDVSYGTSSVTVLKEGEEKAVVTSNSQNMKVSKNGKYNLYLNPNAKKVKVECVEAYTDLKVKITINNKANWNPLYIHLKDGNTLITPAEGALVTNNVYEISGDYIGKDITYHFTSNNKTSDSANVTITKNGATITLEETFIKFTFKLETDNAKQWWGSNSYMYIWESGTSADNSWPGTKMISADNYTWYINLPSELAGKKIKYIINNGSGWQSADQTITISKDGHTVYEKEIGIK